MLAIAVIGERVQAGGWPAVRHELVAAPVAELVVEYVGPAAPVVLAERVVLAVHVVLVEYAASVEPAELAVLLLVVVGYDAE